MYHYFQTDETEKIELYIHTGVAKAISGRCKCDVIHQIWDLPVLEHS